MAQSPVIIITGGGAGIGAAIVDKLLEENAKVVVIDMTEGPLKKRQAAAGSDKFQYIVGDVGEDRVNSKAVEVALETWGKINAVILNAGIMSPVHRICDMSSIEVTKIFNTNVIAHISMLSVAIPHLRETNGRVVFTSSDAGEQLRWKAWGAYGATKAAVNFFIQALTLEEPNIIPIGIYPGIVNTPMVRTIIKGGFPGMTTNELKEYIAYLTPRLVEPHQPGSVMASLALRATNELRGSIAFWNDERFSGYTRQVSMELPSKAWPDATSIASTTVQLLDGPQTP